MPKPIETNILLTLRALANAFQPSITGGKEWIDQVLKEIQAVPYEKLAKTHRVALATLLFKYATSHLIAGSLKLIGFCHSLSCVRLSGALNPETSKMHLSLITAVR